MKQRDVGEMAPLTTGDVNPLRWIFFFRGNTPLTFSLKCWKGFILLVW